MDFTQYQTQLLNILDLVKKKINIFDAREALDKEVSLLSFSENTDEELILLPFGTNFEILIRHLLLIGKRKEPRSSDFTVATEPLLSSFMHSYLKIICTKSAKQGLHTFQSCPPG